VNIFAYLFAAAFGIIYGEYHAEFAAVYGNNLREIFLLICCDFRQQFTVNILMNPLPFVKILDVAYIEEFAAI
jgi:hypothetical protein